MSKLANYLLRQLAGPATLTAFNYGLQNADRQAARQAAEQRYRDALGLKSRQFEALLPIKQGDMQARLQQAQTAAGRLADNPLAREHAVKMGILNKAPDMTSAGAFAGGNKDAASLEAAARLRKVQQAGKESAARSAARDASTLSRKKEEQKAGLTHIRGASVDTMRALQQAQLARIKAQNDPFAQPEAYDALIEQKEQQYLYMRKAELMNLGMDEVSATEKAAHELGQ